MKGKREAIKSSDKHHQLQWLFDDVLRFGCGKWRIREEDQKEKGLWREVFVKLAEQIACKTSWHSDRNGKKLT